MPENKKINKIENLEGKNDIVSVYHLYKNQQKLQENLHDMKIEITSTLENGLKSAVEDNCEAIENNSDCINDLKEEINKLSRKMEGDKKYSEGRSDTLVFLQEYSHWIIIMIYTVLRILNKI